MRWIHFDFRTFLQPSPRGSNEFAGLMVFPIVLPYTILKPTFFSIKFYFVSFFYPSPSIAPFAFPRYIIDSIREGDLPVEDVPQIVLLTFDDSVNDLNKQLYADLFNKGRVNPNGCPISATFYVSHEWTDYSQVQNLYSEGHEMASHTVS